jgi:hypothetical protein
MTDRERLLSIIRAQAIQHYSLYLLARDIRIRWLEGVIQSMDGGPHHTLNQFLKSRAGKRFRRRASIITPK